MSKKQTIEVRDPLAFTGALTGIVIAKLLVIGVLAWLTALVFETMFPNLEKVAFVLFDMNISVAVLGALLFWLVVVFLKNENKK